MSMPDPNNPYHFNDFLQWRQKVDYYADDPFIQEVVRHFTGSEWETVDREARAVSKKVSFRWRDLICHNLFHAYQDLALKEVNE